ncbi:hypothetical protein AA103193_2490 [Tanticharoenia sakaeratensis NBRC 103193]|nr:hypothetical protein AA103193_2490 [Tanticharoenia sakaeratensis NBRC 103193]
MTGQDEVRSEKTGETRPDHSRLILRRVANSAKRGRQGCSVDIDLRTAIARQRRADAQASGAIIGTE